MNNPHKNGCVVFGFPGEGNLIELIRQMRITQPHLPICVVDGKLDELPQSLCEVENVPFVRGGHLRPEIYAKAGIEHQRGVVVFPIDRNDPNSDAITANAVRLITDYLALRGANTKVINLLVDQENEHLVFGLNSQIITKRSDMFLVAQELQGPGTAGVIEDLMRNDQGEDPQVHRPMLTVGITWGEFAQGALRLHQEGSGMPFTPLALLRGKARLFRPPWDTVLSESDRICIVAENAFVWEKAESAIMRGVVSSQGVGRQALPLVA